MTTWFRCGDRPADEKGLIVSEAFWEKYRSNVDKQVEKAGLSEGLKDNPGAGRPLPGRGEPYRENRWLQEYVKREKVPREHYLPTSLLLKKSAEEIDSDVADCRAEGDVRRHVSELNERIHRWLRSPTPPHVVLSAVDVDAVVERWRSQAARVDEGRGSPDAGVDSGVGESASTKPSWWSRLVSRGRETG